MTAAVRRSLALLVAGLLAATLVPAAPVPAAGVGDGPVARATARTAVAEGVVRDYRGRPAAGRWVGAYAVSGRDGRLAVQVQSDRSGRYRLSVRPGVHVLALGRARLPRRDHLADVGAPGSSTYVLRGRTRTRVDLHEGSRVRVRGRLVGPDGRTPARGFVSLHRVDAYSGVEEHAEEQATADDGTFSIPTGRGAYRLRFRAFVPDGGPTLVGGAWPDAGSLAEGTTFRVGPRGLTLTAMRLRRPAAIRGEVTGDEAREVTLVRVDRAGRAVTDATRTAPPGPFSFDDLVPGRYLLSVPLAYDGHDDVTVYWPGVLSGEGARLIDAAEGRTRTGVDLAVSRPGVDAVVATASGLSASRVRVEVSRRRGSSWQLVATGATGAEGSVRLPVPDLGRYRVVAKDPSTGRKTAPVATVVSAARPGRAMVRVSEMGVLEGAVRDADGAPVETDVYVFDPDRDQPAGGSAGAGPVTTLVTDADGRFRAVLPVGSYRLGASGRDRVGPVVFAGGATSLAASGAVGVRAAEVTTVPLDLAPPGTLSGRVTDRLGLPVAGAVVRPVTTDQRRGEPRTTTDGDGRFSIDVAPGDHALQVEAEGFVTEHHPDDGGRLPVSSGAQTTTTVVLGRGSTASGVVTDREGRPAPGIEVVLAVHEPRGWRWVAHSRTGADGSYSVPRLPAGRYRAGFRGVLPDQTLVSVGPASPRPDGDPAGATSFSLADDDRAQVDRVLDNRATVSGVVTGERDGLRPSLVLQRATRVGWQVAETIVRSYDGHYASSRLAAGTYRLVVRGDSRSTLVTRTVTVSEGRAVRLDGVLTGRVIEGRTIVPAARSVLVQAVRRDGAVLDSVLTTPLRDHFRLGPLPRGTYTVRYRDPRGRTADLYDADEVTGAPRRSGAAWYDLRRDLRLLAQRVELGRRLEGRVVRGSGQPLPAVQVMRGSGSRWAVAASARPDQDGRWWVPGLEAGVDYRLRFAYHDYFGRQVADGARIIGGCSPGGARSHVVGRRALTFDTGASRVPPPWPLLGPIRMTDAPSLRGTARVGSRLTVTSGEWAPCGRRVTYQWRRDGLAVPGARAASYRLTAADAGHRIGVLVSAAPAGSDGHRAFRPRGTTRIEVSLDGVVRRGAAGARSRGLQVGGD